MLAVARLDQHFRFQPRAPGAAGHLHQLREQALAGAVVLREQRGIGIEHADERQLLEVVALGDHLRADQDVDVAAVHRVERFLCAALPARGIGVDAQDARLREQRLQAFLDALRAAAERLQIDIAAGRAGVRDAQFQAAVMAAQAPLRPVQHHERRAARAVADPPARLAAQHGRVAAPVQEQQRLLAALHAHAQRLHQGGRQAFLRLVALHVDQFYAWQHGVAHGALAQLQPAVAARLRVVPAFQRRRRRAEHDGNAQLARAPHGQVACRIAQAFLLLVRRVVFLVDDDQAQMRQRRQDRQPRAQHDARAARVPRQPVQHAFAFRQAAVQRRQRHAGEARADVRFQLRRQVDLRDQDQDLRIRIARQHLRAGLQVDLGLAAARHAVQQHRIEAFGAADGVRGLLLGRVQHGHVGRGRVMGVVQLGQLLQCAVERDRRRQAQVLRQARHRHFAQRAVVIGGGKARQRDPAPGQRRQLAAHGDRILQLVGRDVRLVLDGDDQPNRFAPSEIDERQLPDLRFAAGLAGPAVVEQAVERRVDGDLQNAVGQNRTLSRSCGKLWKTLWKMEKLTVEKVYASSIRVEIFQVD